MKRRSFLGAAVAATALVLTSTASMAADWPKRPINLVVPYKAGGTTHSVVQGFNTTAVAWHDLYLVGLLVLLTGLALIRHQRNRPVLGALVAGGVATTIAGIGQLATYTPSL